MESDSEASATPVFAVQEPLERIGLVSDASAMAKDDPSTEVSYGREEDESPFVRSMHNGGDLFTVGTAFTQRRKVRDLQARADAGQEKGFWHMDLNSARGGSGPKFQAEFAQSSFDRETSQGFGSSENRMIKFATFGSWQRYDVGLGYQRARQVQEPVLVEIFIAQTAAERFEVCTQAGFGWLAQSQYDALSVDPCQHGSIAEFPAVVGTNGLRQATCRRQTIRNAAQRWTTDRAFRHNPNRLLCGIIDDGQTLDQLSILAAVEHEIDGTGLVRGIRSQQRRRVLGKALG